LDELKANVVKQVASMVSIAAVEIASIMKGYDTLHFFFLTVIAISMIGGVEINQILKSFLLKLKKAITEHEDRLGIEEYDLPEKIEKLLEKLERIEPVIDALKQVEQEEQPQAEQEEQPQAEQE